jgi:hypothetical protein
MAVAMVDVAVAAAIAAAVILYVVVAVVLEVAEVTVLAMAMTVRLFDCCVFNSTFLTPRLCTPYPTLTQQ